MKHEGDESFYFLCNGVLLTRYSDLANETFLEKILNTPNKDERKAIVRLEMVKLWGKAHPWRIPILLRFLSGFKKGDLVVVPHWDHFGIYKLVSEKPSIIGDLEGSFFLTPDDVDDDENEEKIQIRDGTLYADGRAVDLGFCWKIEPIVHWELKDDYWGPALKKKSFGIWFTTADINDVKGEVEEAISACKDTERYGRNSSLKIDRSLAAIHSNLNPKSFEKLVGHYFKSIGATWVDIPSGNVGEKEGDADVIAGFDAIRTIIYVQVKHQRFGPETDEWAVEQIKKYKEYRDDKEQGEESRTTVAWLVSSAEEFNGIASSVACDAEVQLIDGPTFAGMLIRAGIEFEDNDGKFEL